MDENAVKHDIFDSRFELRIVTSRRYTLSCSVLSQINTEKEFNMGFSRHSLIIIYVSLGL